MSTLVLALDTSTPAVTAGIVRREDLSVLAQRVTVDARAHAERLTPNVVAALADAELTMADLDAVVVGCGPGPFTGLRAGMATAAAYGHALGIPVHGVCSLDAIGVRTTGDTLVVTDARRREVYWARYRDGIRTGGPGVNAPADVEPGAAQLGAQAAHPGQHQVQPLAVITATGNLLGRLDEQNAMRPRAGHAERADAPVQLVAEDPHGGPGPQVVVSHYLLVPAETEP